MAPPLNMVKVVQECGGYVSILLRPRRQINTGRHRPTLICGPHNRVESDGVGLEWDGGTEV